MSESWKLLVEMWWEVGLVLVFSWWLSCASAQTGYFQVGATGSDLNCPQDNPCADPFPHLATHAFDEFVLGAGEYTFSSTVSFSQSVSIRKWKEQPNDDPVVLRGLTGGSPCFINFSPYSAKNISFNNLTIECEGVPLQLISDKPTAVDISDVTIRHSGGALYCSNTAGLGLAANLFTVRTTNMVVFNVSCASSNDPLYFSRVEWIFSKVELLNNCRDELLSFIVHMNEGIGRSIDGGVLSFRDNTIIGTSGTLLYLLYCDFSSEHVEFVGNTVGGSITRVQAPTEWLNAGQMLFRQNTANTLFLLLDDYPSDFLTLFSLIPLQLEDNQLDSGTFAGTSSLEITLCVVPCNSTEPGFCDCNDLPLVSWNVPNLLPPPSSSPSLVPFPSSQAALHLPLFIPSPASANIQIPLVLQLPEGVRYGEHLVTEPLPSYIMDQPTTTLLIMLTIPHDQTEAELILTRLPMLRQDAIIPVHVAATGELSFFLSNNFFQVAIAAYAPPNQTLFKPDQSEVAVSFPNNNKPDHTLSLVEGDEVVANRSITALFGALMEMDEEGAAVAVVSLRETNFWMEELGDTTLNLNNAQPFLSFATEIASLLQHDAVPLNLTEAIRMEVNFTMFAAKQAVSFAGVEQVMAANTLKWSIFLSSWPFQHHNHSLHLHLFLLSEDGPVSLINAEEAAENGVLRWMLGTENTEIPVNVLPLALLLNGDEEETESVKANWDDEEQKLAIELPWFANALLLDPDISLLLTEAEDEAKDKDGEDDGLWWKIVVPVVVVLVVIVVVATVLVITMKAKQQRKKRMSQLAEKLAKNMD
ncbi:hypothetical protein QOT17_009761 [Balamuthia mandrillaris]